MQTKPLSFIFCLLIISACKGQGRVDLATIDFNVPNLHVEEKPLKDKFSIYPASRGSYEYRYKNMEAFRFGNFKFQNREMPGNSLYLYLDETTEHIRSIIISIRYPNDSENFVNYLTSTYGKPRVLEPEPTDIRNGKPFGGASYLWKDILPNRSIILFKNYGRRNGEWSYDISVDYVPTESAGKFNVYDIEVNTFQYLILTQPAIGPKNAIEKGVDFFYNYIDNLPYAD